MAKQRKSVEGLLEEAQETIEGIIRKKFRVSLDHSDGRYENQNAIELRQEVFTLLLQKLIEQENHPETEKIRSIRDYAAVLTYHRCAQLRRTQNKAWHSLKNKLIYFIGKHGSYAQWNDETGDLWCGFVSQKNRQPAQHLSVKLEKFYQDPYAVLPSHLTGKDLRNLKRNDWEAVLDHLFSHLDSAVELDELVSLVADAFGVKDEIQVTDIRQDEGDLLPPIEVPDGGLTPEQVEIIRQFLKKLWQEIGDLKLNQRIIYLLNFRDAGGDIEIFVVYEIAGIEQLADLLKITNEQFAILWNELSLDEETRKQVRATRDYYLKFAVLYAYIPLEDLLIAKLLGGTRQQVIKLRYETRQRLAKNLQLFR